MQNENMKFIYNDGGRKEAGFEGDAGDCTVRSIAIATEQSYQEVYDKLFELNRNSRCRINTRGKTSPRDGGTAMLTTKRYLASLGWKWTPTMLIGSGCKVHLKENELPLGRLIVRVSKHLVAVINGEINDTYDCSREGTRCVYGYFSKES